MFLKVCDGETTHFFHGFDEVRVVRLGTVDEREDLTPEGDSDNAAPLTLWLPQEADDDITAVRDPMHPNTVALMPVRGPNSLNPRTIITDFPVYLLNDNGKTVEVINRA